MPGGFIIPDTTGTGNFREGIEINNINGLFWLSLIILSQDLVLLQEEATCESVPRASSLSFPLDREDLIPERRKACVFCLFCFGGHSSESPESNPLGPPGNSWEKHLFEFQSLGHQSLNQTGTNQG